MSEELSVIDAEVTSLRVSRPPAEVLEEARQAALVLKDVIDKKARKVMFNGEQYLEFEDWQTIGRFYGITAKVESTQFVEYGETKGFTARAVALRGGIEISAAEADCLNDEEKWSTRTKYEWRDKDGGGGRERVKIGEENVPIFQLKSMAQTRAQAKALRNVLAWVVVLAGYKATPAEELPTHQEENSKSSTNSPQTSAAPRAEVAAGAEAFVKNVQPGATDSKPTRITMEDGREGTTFDKKIVAFADEAQKSHAPVTATFTSVEKNGRKFVNLTGLEPFKAPEPSLPLEDPNAQPDTEPVGQPEKVLSTPIEKRKGKGVYWTIQTDKRLYHSTNAEVAAQAEARLKDKQPVIVTFKVVTNTSGQRFNEITEFGLAAKEGEIVPATSAPVSKEQIPF